MADKKEFVLMATGDLGPNRENPDSIFQTVKDTLREADLLFGQLEPCMAESGTPLPQSRLPMRGNPAGVKAIQRAGYDVISFATNHCMDWGREAFFETIEHIKESGMSLIGVGKNIDEARKALIWEKDGLKIGFLGYCSILPQNYFASEDRPGCAPLRGLNAYQQVEHDQPGTSIRTYTFPLMDDLKAMCQDIRKLRSDVDILIVSAHWGIHFVPAVVADYQKIYAYAAIESGADIILGHHTHILKPIEVYKGKPIIYSMANFALEEPGAFAENLDLANTAQHKELQELNPDWKKLPKKAMPADSYKTMLLKCRIRNKKIQEVSFLPVQINDQCEPRILRPEDPEFDEIVEYMRSITASQGMSTRYQVEGGEVYIDLSSGEV